MLPLCVTVSSSKSLHVTLRTLKCVFSTSGSVFIIVAISGSCGATFLNWWVATQKWVGAALSLGHSYVGGFPFFLFHFFFIFKKRISREKVGLLFCRTHILTVQFNSMTSVINLADMTDGGLEFFLTLDEEVEPMLMVLRLQQQLRSSGAEVTRFPNHWRPLWRWARATSSRPVMSHTGSENTDRSAGAASLTSAPGGRSCRAVIAHGCVFLCLLPQEQGGLAGQRAQHVHPAVPPAQQVDQAEDPVLQSPHLNPCCVTQSASRWRCGHWDTSRCLLPAALC